MGDMGSKKAYTGPTKFGCDRSIVVGCRSRSDRQTDKLNGMTIRLTLCERDTIIRQTATLITILLLFRTAPGVKEFTVRSQTATVCERV